MSTGAPAGGHHRPPKSAAGHAGASVRPTALERPTVPTRLVLATNGFDPADQYVRRFWVAAIGPTAVTELLRLVRAAGKGEEVRLPRHLPHLLKAGLVIVEDGALVVRDRLPQVPLELRWRFSPSLSIEHSRVNAPSAE